MNPLIVKGVVFGLLLACAALWDMKEREIPNLIPAMILVCGLIELRPAASVAGLLVTGGPYLLAALLTHGKTLAIGGGDIKLMGALWLCSGSVAWFAAQHFISDPGRAYRSDAVWSTQAGLFFHPATTCPILLHWRRNCLLAGGCGRCNLNKWRYQLEQEYFQKPDDYRCGLYPAGRPGLLWHHTPFQCGFEGPDQSGTDKSRGDSPWHLYHGGYG